MIYECRDISKRFGGVRALNRVSLEVRSGEIRALFGGNGSGKSTLARILGGYVAPDAGGTIHIDGKRVAINSPASAKSHGIVVTSQELSLFYNLTPAMNVGLSAPWARKRLLLDRRQIRSQAAEVLSGLHEEGLLSSRVAQMQESKKYMLEFAKAMAQKIGLLIVDEITSPLFAEEFQVVKETLTKLKESGMAVIFISHRMNEIYAFCDSVSVLRNGEHVRTDRLEAIERETLMQLMTGRERLVAPLESAPAPREAEDVRREPPAGREILLDAEAVELPGHKKPLRLVVHKGEFIGIAGLQGQGQSEVVRSLFGLNGRQRYRFEGRDLVVGAPSDAIKRGIGFISGNRELEGVFRDRSVQENLDVVKRCVLRKGGIELARIIEDYKIVTEYPDSPISSLSGGNQQKIVIGRWLSLNPKLLLADDPNKGVDVQSRSDIHTVFKGIVEAGGSVLMVSSDDEELAAIGRTIPSTRILIMYDGEIQRELASEEITVFNIVNYSHAKGAVRP